uniref:Uncharacterized protein n=1 Tax=Steinernema glaseri TaxID=37863 RepID=A0A1I7Z872_9BILA
MGWYMAPVMAPSHLSQQGTLRGPPLPSDSLANQRPAENTLTSAFGNPTVHPLSVAYRRTCTDQASARPRGIVSCSSEVLPRGSDMASAVITTN